MKIEKFKECYDKLKQIIGNDIVVEPYDSALLVEQYRQFWKPDNVKVILLAESHTFSTEEPVEMLTDKINIPGYPSRYAPFVYCFGYGEDDLLETKLAKKNYGTPDFWKLFYSCINQISSENCFAPILEEMSTHTRIQRKIDILNEMKRRGIWLVDVSIVALYNKGKKPTRMDECIQESWNGYTRLVIEDSKPNHIIVIGKGVGRVIEKDLKKLMGFNNYHIHSQPNRYRSPKERMEVYKSCYLLCNKVAHP